MKNKILIILFIVIFTLFLNKKILEIKDITYQNKVIANIFDDYNTKFEGYIEIPKYKIKRLIKNGTNKKILDKNYVGLMDVENDNLTVLAGHNINLVFHKIHYLKKGDYIYLNNYNRSEKYKVYKILEVNINDYQYFYKKYSIKTLMLITCTKEDNKRFIVLAKIVD